MSVCEKCNPFLPSYTPFPITSKAEKANVKSECNLVVSKLSTPYPCIPKGGYLWNLLCTWQKW